MEAASSGVADPVLGADDVHRHNGTLDWKRDLHGGHGLDRVFDHEWSEYVTAVAQWMVVPDTIGDSGRTSGDIGACPRRCGGAPCCDPRRNLCPISFRS